MKPRFNKTEREILRVLYLGKRPMSIREISTLSDTSWITTKKYIASLVRRGIIMTDLAQKRQRVQFNYSVFG